LDPRPFGLFWNIVKSFAGAGTFALPWAVMNAGLWTGVVGICIFAIFSTYTINTLLKCGQRVMDNNPELQSSPTPPSYPEIGRAAMGNTGAVLVSVYSGLMCFGVCIAYFILIGGNMSALIHQLSSMDIIWMVFPFVCFLSCLTDLKVLSYTSIGGSIALLAAMISVIAYGFQRHLLLPVADYPIINWEHIPLFMGNAAFLFCDHVIVLPLAKSCGNYSRFPRILDYAVIFVVIINVSFAGLAYAFWQDQTCGNVIGNLDKHSVVGDIVRIGISLEVMASFPLVSSAGFQSLETAFYGLRHVKAFPNLPSDAPHPFFSRNVFYYFFRGGSILILAVLASTITSFGSFVSLVGSFTIMATGFVFPQLFYLKLFSKELKWHHKVWQCAIIVFGIGMTALGTYQAVAGLVQTIRHPNVNDPCS
jgi:amino acid permease